MTDTPLIDETEIPPILQPAQPRSGGRTELQQRQKQSSRGKLLAAARAAFAESSYAGAAIDDIVKRAGVNRSTFYRHFDSKFAVAKALFDQFWSRLFAEYAGFTPEGLPTDAEIERWMDGLIAFYRPNRPLFDLIVQIGVLEPEGTRWEETIRQEIVRILSVRNPAFRRASAPEASPESKIRLHMLMMQLELCLFGVAFNRDADYPATVRVIGQKFRSFMARE
jgi:AcrR family transcriptional regulator